MEAAPGTGQRATLAAPGPGTLLGLDAEERGGDEATVTRVYLTALQHPRPTRSLLLAQGVPGDAVDRSLGVLQARGLVRVHEDDEWEVLPPDVALPALASTLERRARNARAAAQELAHTYFQARAGTRPDTATQVLQSLDDIASATAEIVGSGQDVVRCFRAMSPVTRMVLEAPLHTHEQPSSGAGGTALPIQTVYDTEVLSVPGVVPFLQARARGGERFRLCASVPYSAVIVDEAAAVIDLSNHEPSGHGSLLVRSRPTVLGLVALHDMLWNLAAPLALTSAGEAAQQRDQSILALLAAGASDATIARQTGVSQRTVERRIRALMDQLGAGTRFQAGVQAARRGLL
jgi:DNA-binding CsgD family transcriptional regulator